MRPRPFRGHAAYLPLILSIALAAAVLALSWYGYRAVSEWRQSTAALIERNAQDNADRLVTALARDMRGAQALVLANRDSGDYASQTRLCSSIVPAIHPHRPRRRLRPQHDRARRARELTRQPAGGVY